MFQKLFSILKKQMENILTTTQREITIFFMFMIEWNAAAFKLIFCD